jgi:hypothetical protein
MPRSADQSVATRVSISAGIRFTSSASINVVRSSCASRLANMPPCSIGMEACVGAGQWGRSRRLRSVWRGCASSGRFALDCGVHFRAE